jgi:hypothetical protein
LCCASSIGWSGVVTTTGGAPTKTLREAPRYLTGFGQAEVYGVQPSIPLPIVVDLRLAGLDPCRPTARRITTPPSTAYLAWLECWASPRPRSRTPSLSRWLGEGAMTRPVRSPELYCVRIQGHLDADWSAWFDNLTISQHDDGTTALTVPMVDQAALYGLLSRLRDLGATLLSLEWLAAGGFEAENPGPASLAAEPRR